MDFVYLITGCGSGLGQSLVKLKSNNVYKHFRKYDNPDETVLVGDINNIDFLDKFDNFIRKNNINVFINNAGIYYKKKLEDFSDVEIIEILNTNLTNQILMTKRIIKFFKEQNFGIIVNINSIISKFPSKEESVYAASKLGLLGFSKSLQLECLSNGIKIIDVFPGGFKSKITKNRTDYKNLMETDALAKLIFESIENTRNFHINELVVRKNVVSSP